MRAGDRAAYGELYRRHQPELRRYACGLVPRQAADDVVDEAFANVLRAIERGNGPHEHPIRYLMVAVRNSASDHRKAERRGRAAVQACHADRSVGDGPGADLHERDEGLEAAFRALPRRWVQVLWWNEVEGIPSAEIAERLGIGLDAAYALAYRARRGLREAYRDALAAPAAPATADPRSPRLDPRGPATGDLGRDPLAGGDAAEQVVARHPHQAARRAPEGHLLDEHLGVQAGHELQPGHHVEHL